jgi:TonB family protein
MSYSPLCQPYGAYQLKATYQRNMLLGQLIVVTTVATFLLIATLIGPNASSNVVVSGDDSTRVYILVDLPPPPKIDREIVVDPGNPAPPEGIRGVIPTAVDDSLIYDDDAVIYSRDELANLVGPDVGTLGDCIEIQVVDEIDYLPSDTEFVIVDRHPEFVHTEKPEYPRLARQAGIEGDGWIRVLVGKDGKVLDVKIIKSTESDVLDQAAIDAAFLNIFSPAIRDNKPVAAWVSYRFKFRLSDR